MFQHPTAHRPVLIGRGFGTCGCGRAGAAVSEQPGRPRGQRLRVGAGRHCCRADRMPGVCLVLPFQLPPAEGFLEKGSPPQSQGLPGGPSLGAGLLAYALKAACGVTAGLHALNPTGGVVWSAGPCWCLSRQQAECRAALAIAGLTFPQAPSGGHSRKSGCHQGRTSWPECGEGPLAEGTPQWGFPKTRCQCMLSTGRSPFIFFPIVQALQGSCSRRRAAPP